MKYKPTAATTQHQIAKKTAKIGANYFQPRHKRAARSLGFALTSGHSESWFALRDILAASLTDTELVAHFVVF